MISKHIAFYIGSNGLETWEAQEIRSLSKFFRSSVSLFNISQCKYIPLEHPLKTLAMGNKSNELCQLIIEGIDAELAHLVISDYITNHFKTFKLIQTFNFAQQVNLDCQFQHLTPTVLPGGDIIDKTSILKTISRFITPKVTNNIIHKQLLEREDYASTIMGKGVALPHILTDQIHTTSIVLCTLPKPIVWHKNYAPIYCIITIAIPKPAPRESIYAITNLTKNLVIDYLCELLVTSQFELQPFILASMFSKVKK